MRCACFVLQVAAVLAGAVVLYVARETGSIYLASLAMLMIINVVLMPEGV